MDFYFAYEKEVKNLVIKPTLALYVYPNVADSPTTGELQLHLTYNLKDFRFFTHQQMDIATYRFAYFGEYGAGYQYTIHPKLKFDTEASFGMGSAKFNEVYLGFSKTTASTFNYNIGFKYNPWKFLYLKPHFSTTALLNADERNALNKDVWVYGGLAFKRVKSFYPHGWVISDICPAFNSTVKYCHFQTIPVPIGYLK